MNNNKKLSAIKRWSNPEYVIKMKEAYSKKKKERLEQGKYKTIYSRTRIYKLVDKEGDTIYIGSCTCSLESRMRFHIKDSYFKNNLISKKLRECPEEVFIELLERADCKDKTEKALLEQKYLNEEIIKKNFKLLNTNRAHSSGLKPLNKNKGEKGSQYYIENKKKCKTFMNVRYRFNAIKKHYKMIETIEQLFSIIAYVIIIPLLYKYNIKISYSFLL